MEVAAFFNNQMYKPNYHKLHTVSDKEENELIMLGKLQSTKTSKQTRISQKIHLNK